jgi:hypothetical protein
VNAVGLLDVRLERPAWLQNNRTPHMKLKLVLEK